MRQKKKMKDRPVIMLSTGSRAAFVALQATAQCGLLFLLVAVLEWDFFFSLFLAAVIAWGLGVTVRDRLAQGQDRPEDWP